MDIKSVNLETVCGITSTFPENERYEVAFAGKSNVGKSSLINALMNRKALARTSAQPGKTQTVNFYNINDAMYLVDLPGYGYARANIEIKAQWGKMIEDYLHQSKKLRGVFLLIDIRHDPSENDILMYDWIKSQGYAPIIIATKADKLSKGGVANSVLNIKKVLNVEPGTIVIPFSAETKQGREEIWDLIDSLVLVDENGDPLSEEAKEALLGSKKKVQAEKKVEAVSAKGKIIADENGKKIRWKAAGKETGKRKANEKKNAAKHAPKSKKRK